MSAEELEKKEHKKKVIMSIVLGVIMLFSTAGYFVMDFSGQKLTTLTYNNIKFTQNENGLWDFTINGANYRTLFNPSSTQNISINITNSRYNYNNQPLYFSGEPIEDISGAGMQEILNNIQSLLTRINYACISENCSQDYVLKDCKKDNIIIFQQSKNNQSSIIQHNNCVDIIYAPGEAERLADAFLFKILQVT
jgi:hypothetical protein